ncbi:ABC transporter permease [Cryptosporangium sp. NPDC048952]|uniref:ABC transporter permease n=1 Tax=Cryptosporangium sp. NPDC048952 TaxID=3363961 RepID=UPI0037247B46
MSFWEYLQYRQDWLFYEAGQHALLVFLAVAIASVLGVALGAVIRHDPRLSAVTIAITGGLFTVPSLALMTLLLPLLGLGWATSLTALVIYSLLPIVRNTVAGLRAVDPAVVEAARGMGLGPVRTLWRIELPLAWPVVLAGIRVATQLVMGIAAIAAYVAGPGLGNRIFTGLQRLGSANALNDALAGTLGVLVLALAFDAGFVILRRLTTSRGIRV